MLKRIFLLPHIPLFVAMIAYLPLMLIGGLPLEAWRFCVKLYYLFFLMCSAWFFLCFCLAVRRREPMKKSFKVLIMYFIFALVVMLLKIRKEPGHEREKNDVIETIILLESPSDEAVDGAE